MDLLKTILLYLSMLYISAVQVAPDPSTVSVTPTPVPTPFGIVETATPVPTPSPTPVPTPDITPNTEYGQLLMGDRDEVVAELQQKLAELGYYLGEIDGAYGNQTRHAVELFQYQNGLVVDGIAGMYTQTVLFESDEAKPAPSEVIPTSTPVFFPDETNTPPPVTEAPEVTPEITETPSPAPTNTPEITTIPDANLPMLMDGYSFAFAGYSEPVTAEGSDTVLHPVEADEILYVPLTEILQSAGNVVITNTDDNSGKREAAFSILTDFYQVAYTVAEDGSPADLSIEKNAEPQPLITRKAFLVDDILYLPLEDVARMTGIGFSMDDVSGMITVTMP